MIKVNLLSPERKEVAGTGGDSQAFTEEKREQKISVVAIVIPAVITLGIIGFLYWQQSNEIAAKQNERDDLTTKKQQLQEVENTLAELEKTKSELNRKVTLIGELKAKRYNTVKMMDKLSDALPEWVWLTSLTFSGNNLNLNGKAVHNNLIADFINNLKSSGYFNNVDFKNSRRTTQANQDVFEFSLSCNYQEPAADKNKRG